MCLLLLLAELRLPGCFLLCDACLLEACLLLLLPNLLLASLLLLSPEPFLPFPFLLRCAGLGLSSLFLSSLLLPAKLFLSCPLLALPFLALSLLLLLLLTSLFLLSTDLHLSCLFLLSPNLRLACLFFQGTSLLRLLVLEQLALVLVELSLILVPLLLRNTRGFLLLGGGLWRRILRLRVLWRRILGLWRRILRMLRSTGCTVSTPRRGRGDLTGHGVLFLSHFECSVLRRFDWSVGRSALGFGGAGPNRSVIRSLIGPRCERQRNDSQEAVRLWHSVHRVPVRFGDDWLQQLCGAAQRDGPGLGL